MTDVRRRARTGHLRDPAARPRSCASSDGTGQRAAFRGEAERRTRPGGITPRGAAHRDPGRGAPSRRSRRAWPACPTGVSVEPGRIEVRFRGAPDAVARLVALAQALTHDYEQFEALVEAGEAAGGGGALRVEDEGV